MAEVEATMDKKYEVYERWDDTIGVHETVDWGKTADKSIGMGILVDVVRCAVQ